MKKEQPLIEKKEKMTLSSSGEEQRPNTNPRKKRKIDSNPRNGGQDTLCSTDVYSQERAEVPQLQNSDYLNENHLNNSIPNNEKIYPHDPLEAIFLLSDEMISMIDPGPWM